jgi:hypothetical protein
VDDALLASFCTRWKVAKLELFGSMITDPSNARDIDLLVTFAPDARWGLLLLRETPKRVLFEEVLGKMGFKRHAFFHPSLLCDSGRYWCEEDFSQSRIAWSTSPWLT